MKRLNKKGFTLIELLAVIIILGVLMLIAIPSVTEYISNSRKSAYLDTAVSYITSVRNKVNQGDSFKFYDPYTYYLVKVGHDKTQSCVSLEKGGASPFNNDWEFAYVAVRYDGNSYTYGFMAKDGSGQTIRLLNEDKLVKEEVKSSTDDDRFKPMYNSLGKDLYEVVGNTIYDTSGEVPAGLVSAIEGVKEGWKTYNYYVIVNPGSDGNCSY